MPIAADLQASQYALASVQCRLKKIVGQPNYALEGLFVKLAATEVRGGIIISHLFGGQRSRSSDMERWPHVSMYGMSN